MDPYIILAKTEQGAWIETKEIGTSQWSLQQSSKIKQEQLILAQGEDSKKGQLIYLTQKGIFQVILYKMIRFLSGKLKKHTKLAKIVKISEIFNWLVFPLNFNRFCHPMTLSVKYNCVVCVCCIISNFETLWKMFSQNGEVCNGFENTWLRMIYCLEIIWQENRKFQQRLWSATIPHKEDMVEAGCD